LARNQKAKIHNWDEDYRTKSTPWDIGEPDGEIINLVEDGTLKRSCKVLEVGCGTGNDAIYLAKKGFEVVGIDLSSSAIQRAKEKAKREKVDSRCQFYNADVLDLSFLKETKFDFVLDRTCFGSIDSSKREKFKENIKNVLTRNGKFLLIEISNSDDNTSGDSFSEKDLRGVFGADFKIFSLKPATLKHRDHDHKAWKMLALKT
jgi:ubiquinone/menaquinone biosynthesis C-methylase UbiE